MLAETWSSARPLTVTELPLTSSQMLCRLLVDTASLSRGEAQCGVPEKVRG